MQKREETLREAIAQNEEEFQRWEAYKKENETAIENLQEFSKQLTVDVMVPIGRKCFMPGQLIHTNEVLVGHYQGYFSKCTAHKAKEICNMRVNRAKDQLKKLETEAELWTNKLKIPHLEGVVPNSNEREIIEDFDEEQEKRWREEHKNNVRLAKLNEKRKREEINHLEDPSETSNIEKSDENIFKMFEEAELMEELVQELDKLEIEEVNDETLKKLMAGDVEANKPKERIAHVPKNDKSSESKATIFEGVVKKNAAEFSENKPLATNNNNRPNPAINTSGGNDESNDDLEDMTDEVRNIKDQAMFLPTSDQIGFYEYQVEIVRKKMQNLKMANEQDVEEKLHLLTVKEELEDLLALAEEESLEVEDENETVNDGKLDLVNAEKTEELATKKPKKRKVQFASEDDTLLFRRNEFVSQMLPKSMKNPKQKRDIITLDSNIFNNKKSTEADVQKAPPVPVDKKEEIREKVEKNLEFVANNQSQIDCDLITKIIDETESMNRTIYITFQHSTQEPATNDTFNFSFSDNVDKDIVPERPSDFYDLYSKQLQKLNTKNKVEPKNLYVHSYIGEDDVKAPILRETNHHDSYEDPRSTFSLPKSKKNEVEMKATKPILRNKSAVERETHLTGDSSSSKSAKKKRFSDNEDEIMSAYNKVMNDVMEKPLSEPEPLPTVKFIDAHVPKKRVSRFKQSRSGAAEQTS